VAVNQERQWNTYTGRLRSWRYGGDGNRHQQHDPDRHRRPRHVRRCREELVWKGQASKTLSGEKDPKSVRRTSTRRCEAPQGLPAKPRSNAPERMIHAQDVRHRARRVSRSHGRCAGCRTSPAPDAWKVTVAPYLMGAAMTARSPWPAGVDVDMSASDIFSNLQFGAMGLVIARRATGRRRRRHLDVARANARRPGAGVTGSADMSQGAFAFYGCAASRPLPTSSSWPRQLLETNLRINARSRCAASTVRRHGSTRWSAPVAHAGERETLARAGLHRDWRLRRRLRLRLQVFRQSASACRNRPRSSSATAGSTSTTRPARTRRSSSTTCSLRPGGGLRVQVLSAASLWQLYHCQEGIN